MDKKKLFISTLVALLLISVGVSVFLVIHHNSYDRNLDELGKRFYRAGYNDAIQDAIEVLQQSRTDNPAKSTNWVFDYSQTSLQKHLNHDSNN